MNAQKVLQALGKLDGGIAATAASWGFYDPSHIRLALAVAGIAGGLGMMLNAFSHLMGGADVVNVQPPPPFETNHVQPEVKP